MTSAAPPPPPYTAAAASCNTSAVGHRGAFPECCLKSEGLRSFPGAGGAAQAAGRMLSHFLFILAPCPQSPSSCHAYLWLKMKSSPSWSQGAARAACLPGVGAGGRRGGFISGVEVTGVVAATKTVADTGGGGTIWCGRCCLSQQPSETQAAAPPRKIKDKEAPGLCRGGAAPRGVCQVYVSRDKFVSDLQHLSQACMDA